MPSSHSSAYHPCSASYAASLDSCSLASSAFDTSSARGGASTQQKRANYDPLQCKPTGGGAVFSSYASASYPYSPSSTSYAASCSSDLASYPFTPSASYPANTFSNSSHSSANHIYTTET